MIRVIIADDHAVVRQGLKQIVADIADMTIVGEAATGEQILNVVRDQAADILILDLSMPGIGGLDALREVRHLRPELPILILSVHSPAQYGVRMLRGGAAGYLTKESAPDELIAAIRKIVAGGKYLSQDMAEELAGQLTHPGPGRPHESLSDREFHIVRLLALGKRISEIAEELALSPKTVSTYRRRALEKMGLHSNAELTQYALRERLIGPDPAP
jgi:two-component system, NarL family, invasion response regulator UvrY